MVERRAGSTITGVNVEVWGVPAEPSRAGDGSQRPLRSRCPPRLTRSVRLHQIRSALSLGLPRYPRSEREIAMRLKPIRLVVTLALVLLTAPLAAEAQPATKVYRIGNLNPGSPLLTPHLWEAFRQG